jgi:hypothetical protein
VQLPQKQSKVAPLDAVSFQKTIIPNEILLKSATIVTEEPTKELILSTDASLTGLGFTLGQVKDKFDTYQLNN